MKRAGTLIVFTLVIAVSCDVSSVQEAPCDNFFSCNEGIYEGDGEEGGIIDRYVVKVGRDLVVQTDNGNHEAAFLILYYKFENHPAFDNDCFNLTPFRKVEYFIEQNTEDKLEISSRANGTISSFMIEEDKIKWENSETTVFLAQSDIDTENLNICG